MAITNKEKGVWGIDQVYNKLNQGSIWSYTTTGDNYTLWTWGSNTYGALGNNSLTTVSSPIQIPGTTWSDLAFNNYGAYGLKTDGTLWSWGYNGWGELGQGQSGGLTKRSSPIQIAGTWNSLSRSMRDGGAAFK